MFSRYEESLFLVKRDGNMYYNELDTKVKLTKRRVKGKSHFPLLRFENINNRCIM